MENREPCTGASALYPIVDRHDKRIHVGDRMRAQVCVGPYGQTAIVEFTVTEKCWTYCQHTAVDRSGKPQCVSAEYDPKAKVLRCYHRHQDVEHGHETWAEII